MAARAEAAATPARALLVLSKSAHTLAIVDPQSLAVVARVPVGAGPHEVTVSADGKTAWASNTGSGRFHELSTTDLVAQKALPPVDTGALLGPHGLDQAGGKIYFTAEGAKAVARLDPASGHVDWLLGTGQNRTHMLRVTPDEQHVYATNVDSATVSLLAYVTPPAGAQRHAEWQQTVVPVGKGAEGFDVAPDGRTLWTGNAGDGTLSIVDLERKAVIATVDAKVPGANRLAFTPDGKRVLVTSLRSGELVVVDVATRRVARRLPLGHGCAGLLVDPVGQRAFVSCTADDYVAVVDLATLTVTAKLDVGGHPDGAAWAVRKP